MPKKNSNTKLKTHVNESGIKVVWISTKTGIDYDRLFRIINGSEPTLNEARLICAALGKSEHELFEIKEIAHVHTTL